MSLAEELQARRKVKALLRTNADSAIRKQIHILLHHSEKKSSITAYRIQDLLHHSEEGLSISAYKIHT